ncbi:hypothetical protein GLT81_00405 [Nanohaloarchaea archaeon]|nr:hypothetical protein [Candidatus Nanohaloarchaea archaeon]
MSPKNGISRELLNDISQGGFAETMSSDERDEIHAQSSMDDFLEEQMEKGRQVVLTGNPGDGKTQYIMRIKKEFEGYYETDASTREPSELVEEWKEAYEKNKKGIIAINDGPLQQVITDFSNEYEFLQDIQYKMENQLVTRVNDFENSNEDIVVINMSKRQILSKMIIHQTIKNLTNIYDVEGDSNYHISYNIDMLQDERVKDSLTELLSYLGTYDSEVTMRDLLNFVGYCINGGRKDEKRNFSEDLKYYNLAYEGRGKVFDLFREYLDPEDLTHPYLDSVLWSEAEEEINAPDSEYDIDEVKKKFLHKKRAFLFGGKKIEGVNPRDVYKESKDEFMDYSRNEDINTQQKKENLIRRLNRYFLPNADKNNELVLWFTHNFRSKENEVVISRGDTSTQKFNYLVPQLNPEIEEAMNFRSDHYFLEYSGETDNPRLKIDENLHKRLNTLELGVPYFMRDERIERRIVNFMENIQKEEISSETHATIRLKDTETGEDKKIKVDDNEYTLTDI